VRTATATIKDLDISPGGLLKSEGQGDGGLFKGILVRYLTF
jgi:predicted alpha-1,6-mannanase (GH76 family)